eukprot:gene28602-44392_t
MQPKLEKARDRTTELMGVVTERREKATIVQMEVAAKEEESAEKARIASELQGEA